MRRLDQLSAMYAEIMGVSREEARAAIESTPTGQEIAQGNPAYLYEQHTANLFDIVHELPEEVRLRFSDDRILEAAGDLPASITVIGAADSGEKERLRAARMEARRAGLMERSRRGRLIMSKEKEESGHDAEGGGQ